MLGITTRIATGEGLLALATDAAAVPVTYDVSGHGSVANVSQSAPTPPGFISAIFAPGSSVTLDLDRNGTE